MSNFTPIHRYTKNRSKSVSHFVIFVVSRDFVDYVLAEAWTFCVGFPSDPQRDIYLPSIALQYTFHIKGEEG